MSEEPGAEKRDKKPLGGDLVIPAAALLFTLYYFWTIIEVPWTAQVSAFFVGTILIVLIGIFIVKCIGEIRRGEADLGMERLLAPVSFIPKRLALLALTIGFIYFVQYLGFTLTVFLFLSGAMLLLSNGRKKLFVISLASVLALAGWALFIWAFQTRFPAGPFEKLMQGII